MSYTDAVIGVLERAVMTRADTTDELPMLAVMLGKREAIVVSSDGRHQTPGAFLDDVWCACRHLVDPVAVGMVAEFFIRPVRDDDKQSFQPGSLRAAAVYDPEVVTGWGGMVASLDTEGAMPLVWSLHVSDDGLRMVEREDSGAVLLSKQMTARLLVLLNEAPSGSNKLTCEDRRVLFEYVRDSLPAIGLLADRIERAKL
jgi:hypothetical protein